MGATEVIFAAYAFIGLTVALMLSMSGKHLHSFFIVLGGLMWPMIFFIGCIGFTVSVYIDMAGGRKNDIDLR